MELVSANLLLSVPIEESESLLRTLQNADHQYPYAKRIIFYALLHPGNTNKNRCIRKPTCTIISSNEWFFLLASSKNNPFEQHMLVWPGTAISNSHQPVLRLDHP